MTIATVVSDEDCGATDPALPVGGVSAKFGSQPLVANRSKTVAGKKKVLK